MNTRALLVTAVVLVLGSGCNAVFGIDDVSFGTGGGGSTSTSGTSDASSGDVSSGNVSNGTGGGGGGPACEVVAEDIAAEGEFDPGWESAWTYSNVSAVTEDQDGQPVLHVIYEDPDTETLVTNGLGNHAICPGACVQVTYSIYASSSFQMNVVLDDDDQIAIRVVLQSENYEDTGTFLAVVSNTCQLDPTFASPDRLSFGTQPPNVPDYLLDDVKLLVSACTGAEPPCGTF